MNHPDPEDQQRDGPAWGDRSDDDVARTDAAFAGIVAGLQAEADQSSGEDHFEPPEPPPLPIPGPRTVSGLLALAAGLLLLVAPNLLGMGERAGTPLGLLALAAGIGWLLMGLRRDPPPDGSDDGARL